MTTKKLIDTAFVYAMVALAEGVFYREFTKMMAFEGKTTLAITHLHLFALGTLLFLVLALFSRSTKLTEHKQFKRFYGMYNVALPFMVVMFMVRGVLQVMQTPLSHGASAAISGISGLAHILMAVSLVLLFLALRGAVSEKEA